MQRLKVKIFYYPDHASLSVEHRYHLPDRIFKTVFFYSGLIDHDRNYEEAIPLAEQAAAQFPDQVSYLLPLVTAYQKTERNADAVATIDKILKIKPEYTSYYEPLRAQLAGTQQQQP